MSEMTLPLSFKDAYTTVMLGGGISLIIVGGLISKDVSNVGNDLIITGKWIIILSFVLYIVRWIYYALKSS